MVQWWEHSPPTSVARVRFLESASYVGWVCCWSLSLLKEVFLRVLQFSPLVKNQHFQIPRLKEVNICTFCKTEAESLIHLFWSCRITSCFWHSFNQWLSANQRFKSLQSLTPDIILGLRLDIFENKQHYLFFLIARYFIWVRKTREQLPKIENFPSFVAVFL